MRKRSRYVLNFFSEGEEPASPSSDPTRVRFRPLSLCRLVPSGATPVSSSDSEETWRFSLACGASVRWRPFTPGLCPLGELLSKATELLQASPLSQPAATTSVPRPPGGRRDAAGRRASSVLSPSSSSSRLSWNMTGLRHTKSEGLRHFSSSPPGLREFCTSTDEEDDRSSTDIDG